MKKFYLLFIAFFLLVSLASAHQPRLVYEKNLSEFNPLVVEKPEISQAFYGELRGEPEYYIITSNKSFELYINILSPDIKTARKDFSFEVYFDNKLLYKENGTNLNWEKFHEEFAGDNYWRGPEIDKNVGPGIYKIKIYNTNNLGKYSLAIGKKEEFPLNEAINAYLSLPKIKIFFEKSPLTALFNLLGLFLLILFIVLGVIIFLIIRILKKIYKQK